MAPLLRRSLAPRGQPLVLKQRTKHREKVSVAGVLWLSPDWQRTGLFFQTLCQDYFDSAGMALVLEAIAESWRQPVIVVWDQGQMHQGGPIAAVRERHPQLTLEEFPPYAPELNPVEQVWKWLKYDRLCNFAPENAKELEREIVKELEPIQGDQEQLCDFFHTSSLPFPRTLLL
jgi:hypothetical protein